tara:strand:- start:328 stop:1359 length:1032 start_codon:yes stop_codon:yes gene_type:complete
MKVLIFSEAAAGGVLSVIIDQLEVISKVIPDLEVDFVFSSRLETPKNLKEILPRCNVYDLGVVREDKKSLFKMWRGLRSAFPASNYDVIHLHSSISGFVGRLAYIRHASKIIYTPHCYAFLAKERSFSSRALYLVAEAVLGRVGFVAACGDSEYKYARRMLSKVILIRNGVRAPEKLAVDKEVDLISVGRVCEQKGYRAFEALVNKSNLNFSHLWIGGPVEEKSHVSITGWITRAEVLEKLAGGRIYISTAEWEGLPIAPIEAQHFGIPVIALDKPGVRDVVVHGKTGYLCNNLIEMEAYCRQVLDNEDEYSRLSENCRLFALDNFSMNNYLKLAEAYNDIAS